MVGESIDECVQQMFEDAGSLRRQHPRIYRRAQYAQSGDGQWTRRLVDGDADVSALPTCGRRVALTQKRVVGRDLLDKLGPIG